MSTIDERIVEMKFNNGQFQQGVKETTDSLDKLKEGLKLDESAKSLENLKSAGDGFSLAGLSSGVEGIASKFTSLGVIGVTALADITSKAIDTGIELVKSLSVDHIAEGFQNYELGINSVQTILANTQAAGTTLPQITSALKDLNTYANQTVYNFADMTKNIGTFTAAGVSLNTATTSIKGIANLAAMSGSSAEQASGAMYQLSQAIAAGKVGLQDWNSVVNAGLGGKTFQIALENTARASGVAIDSIIKKQGGFRNSLQKGWITSDILTKTLSEFTGDLTLKQLEAMHYTEKQAQAILKMGETAKHAATDVKTFSQMNQALKEEVGTAWASVFNSIIGNIDQAKSLFTPLHNVFEADLTLPIYAVAKAFETWSKFGGRTDAIKALWNVITGLSDALKPIQKAFNDVFPPNLAFDLLALTSHILELTSTFKKVAIAAGPDLYRIFKGLFSILDIGVQVVQGLGNMLGVMFGHVTEAGPKGILDFAAHIGDMLVQFDKAVRSGGALNSFFEGLGRILAVPIKAFSDLGRAIGAMANGLSFDKIGQFFTNLTSTFQPFANSIGNVNDFWNTLANTFGGVFAIIMPLATGITNVVQALGTALTDVLNGTNYNDALNTLNTAFFGGLILLIKKFLSQSKDEGIGFKGVIEGIFKPVTDTLEGVTKTLEGMQQTLKVAVLLGIAAALALLTASIVALSLIDTVRLTAALGAMAVMMAELMGAMAIFSRLSGTAGILKLPIVAAGMVLLAISVDILTAAVKRLSGLDWIGLAKGLSGLTVILLEVAGFAKIMDSNAKGLIAGGAGMILMATAINILVTAVANLGKLDTKTLIQGLIGVAAALSTVAGFTHIVDPKSMTSTGIALVIMASALNIFATAVGTFGKMNINTMVQGLAGMGAALIIVAGALLLMPPGAVTIGQGAGLAAIGGGLLVVGEALKIFGSLSLPELYRGLAGMGASLIIIAGALLLFDGALPGAAALVVAAASLAILAPVMQEFGNIQWDAIGRGLTVLTASMVILAGAMYLMEAGLPGAAALVVMAGALAILAPIMVVLGNMSWAQIGTGLTVLAGALAIIGAAGYVLTPVIPTLLALGGAIALLGLGVGLAGAGILALSVGLVGLSAAGVTGAVGITAIGAALLNLIPLLFKELGLGVIAAAEVVDKGAPAIAKALVDTVIAALGAVVKLLPVIVNTGIEILLGLLEGVQKYAPKLYEVVSGIIVEVLNEIGKNAPKIIDAFANAFVKIEGAIGKVAPRIVGAVAGMMADFLNAISKNESKIQAAATKILTSFINGIDQHLTKVIDAATKVVTDFADTIGRNSAKVVNAGTNAVISFLNAVNKGLPRIVSAATDVIVHFVDSIANNLPRVTDAGANLVIKFVNSLAGTIRTKAPAMQAAGLNLAIAMVDGMTGGLASKVGDVVKAAGNLGTQALKSLAKVINSASPSKEFYKLGQYGSQGFALGLEGNQKQIDSSFNHMKQMISDMQHNSADTITTLKDQLSRLESTRNRDEAALATARKGRRTSLDNSLATNAKSIEALDAKLLEAEREHAAAGRGLADMNGHLKNQKTSLDDLAKSYDQYTTKIKTATTNLADAKKQEAAFATSTTQNFSGTPTIDDKQTLNLYEDSLKKTADANSLFATQMQELKGLGINDDTYKTLLAGGTAGSKLITELIESGKAGIAHFQTLRDQVEDTAKSIGDKASVSLYQAGIDADAGLLRGLKHDQTHIDQQMDSIGKSMVRSIKKALKIKSPSQEFHDVGSLSIDGLVLAFQDNASTVGDAAAHIGEVALSSLKDSMSNVSDLVSQQIDINPTIKPVLDLTGVQKTAGGLSSILTPPSLSIDSAYSSAAFAGNGYTANKQALTAAKQDLASVAPVTYNQYNNSPATLSAAEIYRQTKNQLSVAKGVVVTNAN